MTDEKYTFVQDVREKKDIAKSSKNRRAHARKGGGGASVFRTTT